MRLSFRQGIVSYQTASNLPNFLSVQPVGGGQNQVVLQTGNAPTIITFAQATSDYLYIEPQGGLQVGWTGPFSTGTNYWLYWDINKNTGIRTFGSTLLAPVFGPTAPVSPTIDQHWFDTSQFQMNVWQGTAWIIVIRVFAAELVSGNTLISEPLGTQVNVFASTNAGQILFDDNGNPVRKSNGRFFTTTEQFYTAGSVINSISLDNAILQVFATQPISQYAMVKLVAENQVALANYEDTSTYLIAMAMTSAVTNDILTMIIAGVVINPAWAANSWNVGDTLWINTNGSLTNVDPHVINSLLPEQPFVGRVITANSIYLIPH